jgi:SAM-dependent methyltransferase
MESSTDPWDADYRNRGRLWGGGSPGLPRLPQSARVLELGCGDGRTAAALARYGCRVTAVDRSPYAARLCRSACTVPEHADILIADARQNPFRSESFDAVIAYHIVGHLDRAGRDLFAGEVHRLLAPGGTLYFRDFSSGDFRYGSGEETESGTFMRRNGIATHYFTEEEVTILFSGLEVRTLECHRWEMRVRGAVHPRAEIVAECQKTRGLPGVNATNPL